MELMLQVKHQYGLERIYPKNETAELFCALLGRKTLIRRDLEVIQRLGFTVTWVPQTLETV